ncbi:MAG: hypothetical protein KBT29_04165 [Prevotellaceae bacterium]|nr:hypothetical protein [Candidatus Minthosoma caballi]
MAGTNMQFPAAALLAHSRNEHTPTNCSLAGSRTYARYLRESARHKAKRTKE